MTGVAGPQAPPARSGVASCPFRGLLPFSADDARWFFGRKEDCEIITANLIAARLTLLYAPSGVGKTSVLLAGVAHHLHDLTGEYLPVVVREWSGEDPSAAIDAAIRDAAAERLGIAPPEHAAGARLIDRIEAWAEHADCTLLLILDQFEEFLLYHGDAWEPDGGARELAQVLGARDLRANVLLGLREEALASLDRFKGPVPHLFENYLRLTHLDATAGREAVEGPVGQWNKEHPGDRMEIEPGLADRVVGEVAAGRIALGRTGAGGAGSERRGVEAPFLQLVLERLWVQERAAGSDTLRLATLQRLGGAAEIVRAHLDLRMRRLSRRQRDIAAALFHQLVTPSGTKVARSVQDLAAFTELPEDDVEPVLRTLARSDWSIVRPVAEGDGGPAKYEAFHDVLADAMLDWRARHEEARRRKRLLRRVLAVLAAAALVTAAALLLVASFARQKDEARRQQTRAEAAAALARSRSQLPIDPRAAAESALASLDRAPTPEARAALRAAVAQSDLQGVLKLEQGAEGPVEALRVSPDGRRLAVASEDGRVWVWSLASGAAPLKLEGTGRARSVAFSPDSTRLAVAGEGPEVGVWRLRDGKRLAGAPVDPDGVAGVRWAPRGERLVALTPAATLWDTAGGRSQSLGAADYAAWSPGGERLVTATKDGTVSVWAADGSELDELSAEGVVAVGFNRDGSSVLVAGPDGRVIRAGAPCPPQPFVLRKAAFTSDGGFLVGSDKLFVQVLRLSDCAWWQLPRPTQLRQTDLSTDGRVAVAVSGDGAAFVFDPETQEQLETLIGWPDSARLVMRPDADGGQLIFSAGDDGLVGQWKVAAQPLAHVAEGAGVRATAFDPSGRTVLLATGTGVRRADWREDAEGTAVGDPLEDIGAATFSADGSTVAATEGSRLLVRAVAARRWRRIGRPDAAEGLSSLALSPDGRRLAVAYEGGAATVWDTRTRRRLGPPISDPRGRRDPYATFSADGRRLVVVAAAIRLHGLPAGGSVELARGGEAPKPQGRGAPAAVHGDLLAAVVSGENPQVWNVRTGAPPVSLEGRRRPVAALAFSPGGEVLATAGAEGVRLWDVATGQKLAGLAAGAFHSVSFDPDGRWVLAGGAETGAQVFTCRPCGSEADLRATAAELLDGALLLPAALPAPVADVAFRAPEPTAQPSPGTRPTPPVPAPVTPVQVAPTPQEEPQLLPVEPTPAPVTEDVADPGGG